MAVKKRYNIIGALNDIIMVYPTTKSWDSNKITDEEDNRNGKLVQGILGMIDRVTGTQEIDVCQAPLDDAELSLDSLERYLAKDPA
jgi:hypothetical protein